MLGAASAAAAAAASCAAAPSPSPPPSLLVYFARLWLGFYAVSVAASLWVWLVARRWPPGAARLAAVAPVVLLQLAATPALVDRARTPVLIVPVCGTLSLAAFKVAAFGMGRGPLALARPWAGNLLQFGVVLSLPVIPADAFKLGARASVGAISSSPPATWRAFAASYASKAACASAAASLAVWPLLPELLRHWFYALTLSLTLGALWDFWCCAAVALAGIPAAPSFDKPWLSTSFADYWSRRWNLTTAYLLRVLIYEPIRDGSLVPPTHPPPASSPAAPAPAAWPAGPAEEEDDEEGAGAANRGPAACIGAGGGRAGDGDRPALAATRAPLRHRKAASDSNSSSGSSSGASTASVDTAFDAPPAAGSLHGAVPASCSSSALSGPDADVTLPHSPRCTATAIAATTSSKQAGRRHPADGGVGKLLRRAAGLHATFVFSGLWHLLIFYYATGLVTPHWLAFFSLQGPIMAAEAALGVLWRARGWPRLPPPLAVLLTNFLLILVARPLFFGPCDWSGLCSAMMANVRAPLEGGG